MLSMDLIAVREEKLRWRKFRFGETLSYRSFTEWRSGATGTACSGANRRPLYLVCLPAEKGTACSIVRRSGAIRSYAGCTEFL